MAVLALLLLASPVSGQDESGEQASEATTVVSGDIDPVDIAIEPTGEIWWNDFASGNVYRLEPDTGIRQAVFRTDPIPEPLERGLVGLALDPDVHRNGIFYVYYTLAADDADNQTNYLSRVEDGQETKLLEVPANERHNGGRIAFDDEGRMFVSTGDNMQGHQAQNVSSLLGKILHLHPDGTPADDTIDDYVYSTGHRNVYGLAYDRANDRLFATENGRAERDEINLVRAGANYGWPYCEGAHRYHYAGRQPLEESCEIEQFTDPIGVFYDESTAAPTGATVFEGDLYWASYNEGSLHRLSEDDDGWSDAVVFETDGRISDVESHNGSLYLARRGAIVRLDDPLAGTGAAFLTEIPDPSLLANLAVLASLAALVRTRR